jgi:hypothetical protein
LKESSQPIESRSGIHRIRLIGSPPVRDPVAVSAYLIHLLDETQEFFATAFEYVEQPGKASMLDVLNGVLHDPH